MNQPTGVVTRGGCAAMTGVDVPHTISATEIDIWEALDLY